MASWNEFWIPCSFQEEQLPLGCAVEQPRTVVAPWTFIEELNKCKFSFHSPSPSLIGTKPQISCYLQFTMSFLQFTAKRHQEVLCKLTTDTAMIILFSFYTSLYFQINRSYVSLSHETTNALKINFGDSILPSKYLQNMSLLSIYTVTAQAKPP